MTGDKELLSKVTLSRTLIPTLPAGYLSRKHLFSLIENESSGSTLVIAGAGYGKTSLVAEWAKAQSKKVIWMTLAQGDSISELSAMLIAATRHVIAGFGEWFERDQPIRPTDVVRRWGNELLQSGENFIFVLDILRVESEGDVEIANQLVLQFPSNIHFIAIRKDEIDSLYPALASRGPLKIISGKDLKFSEDEISLLAKNVGIELNPTTHSVVLSAQGWPAATSLLIEHIRRNGENNDIAQIMTSSREPLRALALLVVEKLDPRVVGIAEKLSVLETFGVDEAKLILGDEYSYEVINEIAFQGEIFTYSPKSDNGFVFSNMMREIFKERLSRNQPLKNEIQVRLISHFERQGDASAAIEHAFEAGDYKKISELFPSAARLKQARGQGGVLLRWAKYAQGSEEDGALKASTVRLTGFLANIDFSGARAEIETLLLGASNAKDQEFFFQIATGAKAYIHLSNGEFPEVEACVRKVIEAPQGCLLGIDDQINLLRLLAAKHCIYNEREKVAEIYELAQQLAAQSTLKTSHTFLLAIHAMKLHQEGEYRRAYEMALTATRESQRHGFVGLHGPLDSLYVTARCLLEFSRPQDAFSIFEQIRNLSYQWKQWHWYFVIEDNFFQDMCLRGAAKEALERLRRDRELTSSFHFPHQLNLINDINEMYIRRFIKDFDRLEIIVNRAPQIRQTQQFKMAVDEFRGRKTLQADAMNLPEQTPREKIWKSLMTASLNIDKENVALPAMREAMKIGATVGAKETFLRQKAELGNLIIRVANENPTVYNEELASAMAERIKDRGTQMTEGHPTLTKRELEILRQLSTGRTLTIIAGELHISQNTMKTHLKNLYRKLSVEGRKEAVEKANSLFLL